MDRLTRHELKQDEFREAVDQLDDYLKTHLREILTIVGLVVVVVGATAGLKYYLGAQEASANLELAGALRTFEAYVGNTSQLELGAESQSFSTANAKYQKALEQFNAIDLKYRMFPRPKAVSIARYEAGICESLVGNPAAAINTLQQASRDGDKEIGALAQFALAGELFKTGKKDEAIKIYQNLADHPTLSVPKTTAQLGLADAVKNSEPQRARQLYQQIEQESGSNPSIAEAMKQQITDLHQ
jgi:tetratricopeptide (TPR) repeat protein